MRADHATDRILADHATERIIAHGLRIINAMDVIMD